jgi:hypothetical protein
MSANVHSQSAALDEGLATTIEVTSERTLVSMNAVVAR